MELTREVRFSLTEGDPDGPITNSWGGWPTSVGLAPYLVLRVTVTGAVDPITGYLCNITVVDRAVREAAIPLMRKRWLESDRGRLACESLLQAVAPALAESLPIGVGLHRLQLRITPFLRYTLDWGASAMVSITQCFEFAAAHRLYCSELSEEENLATFGKCTNPNGHGHNYMLEVTVEGEPQAATGVVLAVGELEAIVKAHVVDVFDHKHLNEDCPEFADLNPSVENITRVIWDKLAGRFGGARLAGVRVYETPKTMVEYRGG